jgi:hypothetical protein
VTPPSSEESCELRYRCRLEKAIAAEPARP